MIFCLGTSICLADCEAATSETRSNILFIMMDYMRGADLPVAGLPLTGGATFLKAPTIERLCREGAVFGRHNCVAPICMPARATVATGHYPHVHGLWDNRSISLRAEGRPFLISDLQRCGYQTIGIGKMHFHPFDADYDYDIRISLEGKDRGYRDDDYEAYLEQHGCSRKKIIETLESHEQRRVPRGQSSFDWPLDEHLQADAFVGLKTLEAIQADKLAEDKPWFMWISFTGPHNPWNAPKRFAEPYRKMADLPDGEFAEGELDTKPIDYTRHRYGYGGSLFDVYDRMTAAEQREVRRSVRAGHYGMISFIDQWIGKILEALEQRGQLQSTLVVLTADHGSALFDNGMLHKGSSFPTQSLVPFVVWQPGEVRPGLRRQFTSHVDVYATFMALAGDPDPNRTQGQSMVPLFQSKEIEVRDFNVVESTMVTSIMSQRWLAGFHHITGETELYDLQVDPMCHRNIAGDPVHANTIESLKAKLVQWRRSIAGESEHVSDEPLQWRAELGDPTVVDSYFSGYMKQFRRLVSIDGHRPGRTGPAAAQVLDSISNTN